MPSRRGTTNGNVRGNNTTRRERRAWLIDTYRADTDALVCRDEDGSVLLLVEATPAVHGTPSAPLDLADGWTVEAACRCYRCGDLLLADTLTVDRIKPGVRGGTYGTPKRDTAEGRTNVRPACEKCNPTTGGALAGRPTKRK